MSDTICDSDCCDCIIQFNNDTQLITVIHQQCKTHNDSIGDSWIGSEAQSHNKTVNSKVSFSTVPTEAEMKLSWEQKEKDFIKKI